MQRCPNCGGGELKIIAAILERPVIERILSHLGLDPQPPSPESGARGGARLRYLSRADRQRYLAPGCADNGSQDGAAPHVGSMPMYSGSTLVFRRSEPQSNRMGNGPAESRQDNGADASSKPSRTATIGHPCVSRASHRPFEIPMRKRIWKLLFSEIMTEGNTH